MKVRRIKRRSEKKILRDEVGKLHFQYLKLIRNNNGVCEICRKPTQQLGRFHILRVGAYPKLEFVDFNVLLTGWFCCHYPHHHFGGNDDKVQHINKRIIELRGEDYKDKLMVKDKCMPKVDMFYLNNMKLYLEEYLKSNS